MSKELSDQQRKWAEMTIRHEAKNMRRKAKEIRSRFDKSPHWVECGVLLGDIYKEIANNLESYLVKE